MVALRTLLFFLAISLNSPGIMAAPFQPGGISGPINWWKDNSFNSSSSDYLYQSFRTKVFEPLISGILADVKKLKEGQVTSKDIGYGSLAAAILAVIGILFMLFKLKSAGNKSIHRDNLPKQKENNGRVL